ncbi:MAG: hypothetical protein P8179_04680 [Candidatus Thiodiazotropha sp.]
MSKNTTKVNLLGFELVRFVWVLVGACGGAGQGSLLHIHVPPQACHSCCSVIHSIGEHNHRSYFL